MILAVLIELCENKSRRACEAEGGVWRGAVRDAEGEGLSQKEDEGG